MKIETYKPTTHVPPTSEQSWFGTQVHLYKDIDNNNLLVVETDLFDRIWAAVKWLFCWCSNYEMLLTARHVSPLTLEEAKSTQKADQAGNAILQTQASAPPAEVTKELSPAHSVPLSLLSLPSDILRLIFTSDDYLDECSKTTCRSTCKKLRDLIVQSPFTKTFCTEVARTGNLALLKWARANRAPWDEMTCAAAAAGGHLEVLQWARADTASWWKSAQRAPWDRNTYRAAASGGHLDLLKWSYDNGLVLKECELVPGKIPAERGDLAMLQWLHTTGVRFDANTCATAAKNGHLNVLQWLRTQGTPWNENTCFEAARGGHLTILQWARDNGAPWNELTCYYAALGGHLEILQWARANGAPWDARTCHGAAKGGHLEILHWARDHGARWDALTCQGAAMEGYLEILQWAHANGAPWEETTCSGAACRGHLGILQWARANGAPWNTETCDLAARGGHLDILQWARANEAPWNGRNICRVAISHSHLDVLQWAHANGAPLNVQTTDIDEANNLEVLQWLRSVGVPWGQRTCWRAAIHGDLDRLIWAIANGAPFHRQQCIESTELAIAQESQNSSLSSVLSPWEPAQVRSRSKGQREVLAWLRTEPPT